MIILESFADALPPDLLKQLKWALNHHNLSKFNGYMTEEQRKKSCASVNYASVSKKLAKVEKTLNK